MKKDKVCHIFDIADIQFICTFDHDYKNLPLWYVPNDGSDYIFDLDIHKGFRTPEKCEAYIKSKVKQKARKILKEVLG